MIPRKFDLRQKKCDFRGLRESNLNFWLRGEKPDECLHFGKVTFFDYGVVAELAQNDLRKRREIDTCEPKRAKQIEKREKIIHKRTRLHLFTHDLCT